MNIVGLLVLIVVIGFCLWLVTTYVPMNPPVKAILVAVVVLILVVFLLSQFGLLTGGSPMRLR